MDIYGDGSDGILNALSGNTDLLLNTKYQFSEINIAAGATLSTSSTDGSVLYLLCSGTATINGTIDLKGKVRPGAGAASVTIDGTLYEGIMVGSGGYGGRWTSQTRPDTAEDRATGFGGGGSGYFYSSAENYATQGRGGPGGSPGGTGGAGRSAHTGTTSNKTVSRAGVEGGTSAGGGGGALGAFIRNSGDVSGVGHGYTGGKGGNAYGANGANGANPAGAHSVSSGSGNYTYNYMSGGGGGAGGIAGRPGVRVVINARRLIINGTIITAGTNGGKGGNGGRSYRWDGETTSGLGGGGGGGGYGGPIQLTYSDQIVDNGTYDMSGGTGGAGGLQTNTGDTTGGDGSNGLPGIKSVSRIGRYLRTAGDTTSANDQVLWQTNQKPVASQITADGIITTNNRMPLRFTAIDNEADDIEYEIEIYKEMST